jgi:RNA polymerase sigma-70 factor (ECF subfamily)
MSQPTDINQTVFQLQEAFAISNDSKSFEKLYVFLYKDLHRFAFNIIKSRHIAEEIVSDVFVQLWKRKESVAEINNLRVFLYVAVKNLSLTYLYKARKYKVCWIEEYAGGSEIQLRSVASDELLIAKEIAENLQKAIRNLPDRCKAIFKLVKEDGLKYAEAARILNLSVKTIENQMGIALKKIALSLKESYQA